MYEICLCTRQAQNIGCFGFHSKMLYGRKKNQNKMISKFLVFVKKSFLNAFKIVLKWSKDNLKAYDRVFICLNR